MRLSAGGAARMTCSGRRTPDAPVPGKRCGVWTASSGGAGSAARVDYRPTRRGSRVGPLAGHEPLLVTGPEADRPGMHNDPGTGGHAVGRRA
jgi:hypothetical protein